MSFDLSHYWYRKSLHPIPALLLPFSYLFQLITDIRRWLYRKGIFKIHHFEVPVIVVGNITVGGTGKTPFVIELAKFLQSKGFRPGIVSRGVGGEKQKKPHRVKANDAVDIVGDEALLLLQNTGCPVVICVNRVRAVQELLQFTASDVVISDDGLQHYRLGRSFEIAMIDAMRELGNKFLLPAGPLREKPSRLMSVDMTVMNGGNHDHAYQMRIEPEQLVSLTDQNKTYSLKHFPHKKIHLVAGIGHPEQFFALFKEAGFDIIPHFFQDHYLYKPGDFDFNDALPIVMTEKDAVKVGEFADRRYWYLRITAKINNKIKEKILTTLGSVDNSLA